MKPVGKHCVQYESTNVHKAEKMTKLIFLPCFD